MEDFLSSRLSLDEFAGYTKHTISDNIYLIYFVAVKLNNKRVNLEFFIICRGESIDVEV